MLTIELNSDRILDRMKRDQFCDLKYITLMRCEILKKQKKKNPHQVIWFTLNRLQIPVYVKFNNDIKNGKYNDPKKPIEFYNEFLAEL